MRTRLFVLSLPLAACTAAPPRDLPPPSPIVETAVEPVLQAPQLAYPHTRRLDLVETQFGVPVPDPYRWLENDVRTDPEVKAPGSRPQNAVTNAFLAALPARAPFKARMTELYDYERFGVPEKKGRHYFYTRNDGLQNQSVLYVRDSVDGQGRVLIDPNTWSADGATALAEWVPSEDGTRLLYSVQDGGTDWRTVRVLDVTSAKPLADEVKWVKFSGLSWAKDGSGFYYSRFPAQTSGTFQSLNENHTIYFHRMGTPQSADRLVFATPKRPDLNNTGEVSDDGRWLVVTSSSGTDARYEITLVDLKKRTARPRVLIPGFDYDYTFVGNRGSTFYFVTNQGAPKLKVVSLDIARAKPAARTVIAEDQATLEGARPGRRGAGRELSGRRQERGSGARPRRRAQAHNRAPRDRQHRRISAGNSMTPRPSSRSPASTSRPPSTATMCRAARSARGPRPRSPSIRPIIASNSVSMLRKTAPVFRCSW